MKKAFLFLNGEPPARKTLESLDYGSAFVVCADGAYNYLKDFCTPDIWLGDFDSFLPDSESQKSANDIIDAGKIITFGKEKDYTDGHLAMQFIIDSGAKKVEIYGALGNRADHEIANFSLLALAQNAGLFAVIKGEEYDVFLTTENAEFKAKTAKGKTVSLVPFTDSVHILTTRGLKYPITDEIYGKIHIKGISNVAAAPEIAYCIKSGRALIFIDK